MSRWSHEGERIVGGVLVGVAVAGFAGSMLGVGLGGNGDCGGCREAALLVVGILAGVPAALMVALGAALLLLGDHPTVDLAPRASARPSLRLGVVEHGAGLALFF